MFTKEKDLEILGILSTAFITVAGFAIGGTIGATTMAGVGINLAAYIIQSGCVKLKERWLGSADGILNHDIQKALFRAFIKALKQLEAKYFELHDVNTLPKKEKESIKSLFNNLIEQEQNTFLTSIEKTLKGKEVEEYLYGTPGAATSMLWERLNGTHFLSNYSKHFREFLYNNLLNEVLFWFGEELKTDNSECNKAWRAFQRFLLEGMQADVKAVQASQVVIQQDLQKLNALKNRLDEIKDIIDRRVPNEPLQQDFEKALNQVCQVLYGIDRTTRRTDQTTQRTENKIDTIVADLADVKTLMDSQKEAEAPKIPDNIKDLIEKLKTLIDDNKLDDAEALYKENRNIIDSNDDDYSKAKVQRQYARLIKEKYYDHAKENEILIECLHTFEKYKQNKDVAAVKEALAQVNAILGDYNSAEVYANDFLEYVITKNDDNEIASAYITLGFVQMEKHEYSKALACWDESIKHGTRLTHSNDEKAKEKGIFLISCSYQNKTIIYKNLGNIAEAKACCLKALEGHRKLDKKEEIGKLLFLMTELECFEGNFAAGKWKEYIEEAKSIFRDLKNYSWVARCINLVSRIAYTLGQKELSLEILKEGYEAIKKSNDKEGIAHYLGQFASYHINQKKYNEAKKYLEELIEYAEAHKLERSLVSAYQGLADIAEKQGNLSRRDEHLNFVIRELEKEYNKSQSEVRKANILGEIGDVHTHRGNLRESLNIYERIVKIYEELNEIGGYAKATLIVAELNIQLGNREKAFEYWLKVGEIVKGTAFHEFAAISKINSGSFLIRTCDYITAQRHLEEAQHLILKYKLKHSEEVECLLKEVKDRRDITNPGGKTFSQMVNRLYDGIAKNRDDFHPILRHWYCKYGKDLYKHFYNHDGLKAILYSDDLNTTSNISNNLAWLFEYFLIVSKEVFKRDSYDLLVYPYDDFDAGECFMGVVPLTNEQSRTMQLLSSEDKIIAALNKPTENGKLPQYVFIPTEIDDGIKVFLAGWGKGLPMIAYDFINSNEPADIISGNRFVLNIDRFAANDKFYSDVLFCWQLGYIPTYINEELNSEDVHFLGRVKTAIPFENLSDKTTIVSAKKLFNSLFKANKENAIASLNDFKFDMESLFMENTKKISITVSLVEFQYAVKKVIHPIITLNLIGSSAN